MRSNTTGWLIVIAAIAISSCGGSNGGSMMSPSAPSGPPLLPGVGTGPLTFRTSPIALDAIRWITPLGNLNPPAHALPTDHIYFYFANPDAGESPLARRTDFFAPADGVIGDLFGTSGDRKLWIQAAPTIYYYVDHLMPEVALARGTRITAGQRLGTTGSAYGIDLGVVNYGLTLTGFVNPARYIDDTLHADAPLKYFEEPLRSQLYARVQRIGGDLDGRIDYDVPGRLIGNWFQDMVGTTFSASFVYDTYDPSQVRIAISTFMAGATFFGTFAIAPGDPLPRDVSAGSGIVRYSLIQSRTGPPTGFNTPVNRMLVQMLDDRRMQLEILPASSTATEFSANPIRFSR